MAIKFEKIQPGMTLWTTERRRMGNTTMRETVAVSHYVKSVEADRITVSRNGRDTTVFRRRAEMMRASNPECAECGKVGGHWTECSKKKAPRAKVEVSDE